MRQSSRAISLLLKKVSSDRISSGYFMNDRTFTNRVPLGLPGAANGVDLTLGGAADQAETLDLIEYWRSITKRKWSILGLVALVVLIATLVVFSLRPEFRSTATVMIEQSKAKVVSIEEVYNSMGSAHREYYQTQVEIIKSRELAQKVVERLKIHQHPDYDPRQTADSGVAAWLPTNWFKSKVPQTEEQIMRRVVRAFSADLQVTPVRNSQLVHISFTAYDKDLAAKVPNVLADVYIENDLEAKVKMTQRASAWLTSQMGELRTKLEGSEKSLQEYRERERIVDAKGVALSGAARALEEASTGLVSARARRAEAESLYNQVVAVRQGKSAGGLESIPAVLRHPTVQKMKELEAEAERKLADASKRYGPEHPRMVQANAELSSARDNTRRQIDTVVAGVAKEYEVARANEQALAGSIGQSKAEIQGINRKEFQLGVLEREAQANRQLYDMFLNRFKETNVAADLQSTVARVVDPSIVAASAFAPKKTQIVSIAAVVALIIGMMLSLLLDRINNTINTAGEVESRLGAPMLGYLQKMDGVSKKSLKTEMAFLTDSQSLFSESIRTIRTSVLMSAVDSAKKVLVITSTVPEEGKTTVSFNMACALAQVKRVLLVDADLRRPKIGRVIGLDKDAKGLSHLVSGVASASECIVKHEQGGFHILSAGFVPPNPLEMLSSAKFQDVVEKLKEAFDIVLIDSPPVQLVSDAIVLSQISDTLIYVVKAGSTPYTMARNCLRRLAMADAPILGIVLNQLDLERAEKYYGEYSGYGRYRGYKGYYAYGYGPQGKKVDA
jgi:polysaccharide biosynthesis transport protein